MTTLDQVRLLEEKVESAVTKMQQLQAENDALRKKCAELTNALSSKTEQLSSFSTDKSEIEDGIKKALDRLSYIENSVLKAGLSKKSNDQTHPTIQSSTTEQSESTIKPEQVVEQKKVAPQSIQITPGVSKINEEELHNVRSSAVARNTAPTDEQQQIKQNTEHVRHSPANVEQAYMAQQNITPVQQKPITNDAPLSFDTMEDADGYSPAPEEEADSYGFDNTESFDDMGLDSAFDIFPENPSSNQIPNNDEKGKEIIF